MPPFETSPLLLILTAVLAYLLGSTPFGIVMARLFGLGDLRRIGSGNIGATNVLRTGNKLAAFLTLIGDAGKAGVAVLIARAVLADDAAQVAGLFAVLGHLFPIYLRFRGGKGVATLLGTLLALHWPIGVFACLTWLVMAAIFRISSLAALVAAALAPVAAPFLGYAEGVLLLILIGALVWAKHAPNIRRIAAGTEPRIGQGK